MQTSIRRQNDRLYYLGELAPEDKGVLVRRVRRLTPEQITSAISIYSGEFGANAVFDDGLIVVGDTVAALRRVSDMLDAVEAAEVSVWVVQFHLVGWGSAAASQFGIDAEPAARAGLSFAAGSAIAEAFNWDFSAALDAVLQVANTRDDVTVMASPMALLVDGRQWTWSDGERVPVPRRVTTDQGVTRTEGFDEVQVGASYECKLRESSLTNATLEFSIEVSDRVGEVEGVPIRSARQLASVVDVEAGGVYLLGSIDRERKASGLSLGWQTQDRRADEERILQVWCTVSRVGSPLSRTVSSVTQGVQVETESQPRQVTGGWVSAEPTGDDASQLKPLVAPSRSPLPSPNVPSPTAAGLRGWKGGT